MTINFACATRKDVFLANDSSRLRVAG